MDRTEKLIWAGLFTLALLVLVFWVQLKSQHSYESGYKQAFEDYKNGYIDCVVKVKYPHWIQELDGGKQ